MTVSDTPKTYGEDGWGALTIALHAVTGMRSGMTVGLEHMDETPEWGLAQNTVTLLAFLAEAEVGRLCEKLGVINGNPVDVGSASTRRMLDHESKLLDRATAMLTDALTDALGRVESPAVRASLERTAELLAESVAA